MLYSTDPLITPSEMLMGNMKLINGNHGDVLLLRDKHHLPRGVINSGLTLVKKT
jgi:hypothetical protein